MVWLIADSTPLVIAFFGVILTPLVTYLVAAKRFSGQINSSEAADLWEESRSIRTWSQERIKELESANSRLTERCQELERRCASLEQEIRQLKGQDEPPGLLA